MVGNAGGGKPPEKETTPSSTIKDEYDKMISSLVEIDNKYSSNYVEPTLNLPDTLGMEKLTYQQPTQEAIEAQAQTDLLPDYLEDKANIEISKKKDTDTISNQIKQKENVKTEKIRSLSELLEEKIQQVKNTAVNKGTSRGSIVGSAISAAESDYAQDVESVNLSAQAENELLAEKLSQIEEEAKMLLEALAQTHDAELKSKITKLLSEAEEKRQEIIEYNNKLAEKETKYIADAQTDYAKAKQDELKRVLNILDFTNEHGIEAVNQAAAQEKYRVAKNYFDTLSPQVAWDIFNTSGGLESMLGDYYAALYAYVKTRAGK